MSEDVKILAVDTALGACSAALLDGSRVLARCCAVMERGHAEALAPMVRAVMSDAKMDFAALDRLAVTVGPGTFTGQRVGLAFMRGLRAALHKPLLGVTSLSAMAEQARSETGGSCAAAIHDARRGEVYVEVVGNSTSLSARVMAFADAGAMLRDLGGPIVLAGTAAPRMSDVLKAWGVEARLSPITAPDAVWVAHLAARMVPQEGPPPRPLYLRAPDAKLPVPTP